MTDRIITVRISDELYKRLLNYAAINYLCHNEKGGYGELIRKACEKEYPPLKDSDLIGLTNKASGLMYDKQ